MKRPHALFRTRRAGYHQRAAPWAFVQVFKKQKWQTAKVIPMQVADRHEIKSVGIQA
jgi:hypothetical protein